MRKEEEEDLLEKKGWQSRGEGHLVCEFLQRNGRGRGRGGKEKAGGFQYRNGGGGIQGSTLFL